MALITIAGNVIPTPSEYTALTADIVDAGRNSNGRTVAQVIRSDVAKITMKWKYLTVDEWAFILNIFKANFYNEATYFDQASGAYQTRTFYVGDRSGGMAQMKDGVPSAWLNCSLSLVEA